MPHRLWCRKLQVNNSECSYARIYVHISIIITIAMNSGVRGNGMARAMALNYHGNKMKARRWRVILSSKNTVEHSSSILCIR